MQPGPNLIKDFPFVGQAYAAADPYQDSQQCINWYPEISNDKNSKSVIALLSCPGLVQVASAVGL